MNRNLQIVLIYIAVISVIGFVAMGVDKAKAKAVAWRIPERTLLGIAFIGGGAGVWLGMKAFRHKTRHLQFSIGVPCISILEYIGVLYVFS